MTTNADAIDEGIAALVAQATAFLSAQRWCKTVDHVTPVFAVVGVVGVFRCALTPAQPQADPVVWVVVGDMPPAYLVHEAEESWQSALDGYVHEMQRWVAAVRAGQRLTRDIIPVNIAPTAAHADQLATRLNFITERLIKPLADSVPNDV